MKNPQPAYIILIAVICLAGYYYYYKHFRGYYDTVEIDDLSQNASYVAAEPSYEMDYNFMWIKMEGLLYGETDLVVKRFCKNVEHPGYPDFRDSVIYHFQKQGRIDTLIRQDCYCAVQLTFHNIPKPKTEGNLKVKIHIGEFL
jgi:hypothetical protein